MTRPTLDSTMLAIAYTLSLRATCRKLQVGCVLVNARGHIIGTGWNGSAHGTTHCIDTPCSGAFAPSGSDLCEAIHAETNALLQCRDVWTIATCYTTVAPCMRCSKELLNTSCGTIVFSSNHRLQPQAVMLWERAGRVWRKHEHE